MEQLSTILWKNICIQSIRRHYLRTSIEILLVAASCHLVRRHYADRPRQNYSMPQTHARSGLGLSLTGPVIVYGPPSAHTIYLQKTAFTPTTPAPSIPTPAAGNITAVNDDEEFLNACNRFADVCFYVHSKETETGLNYTLLMRTDKDEAFGQKHRPQFIQPFLIPSVEDILSRQEAIESAHLQWILSKYPQASLELHSRQFPFPRVPPDVENYATFLAMFFPFTFVVPFCLHVSIIVGENASGVKEMLRLMGLCESIYWLGHLCTFMLTGIVSTGIILVFFVFLKGPANHRAVLDGADPSLVWFILLLFFLMTSMHTMLVACVFKRNSTAVTFCMIYWLALTFIVPWSYVEEYHLSISSYLYASRVGKLLTSATPCLGTYWTLKIVALACDTGGRAGWDLVTVKVLQYDNIKIIEVWGVMTMTIVLISVLVWYLTRTVPWVTGIPQPVYFPFMPSYWCQSVDAAASEQATDTRDPSRFEAEPQGLEAVVHIKGLVKNFGTFTALDGIDLKFYKNEITILLGHNGAGKTTMMSILTGMMPPTRGTVIICGHDIVRNTARARKNVSLCPQFDIFFDDLTVQEHLWFFGAIKGTPLAALRERVDEVLKMVNLTEKSNNLAHALSGGMKRRLSVAIATVSSPQVIILDEPSAGMDPETRREVWDLFIAMRKRCSLLLSTHDMEEADVLGDRIAIMSQGNVRCWGTPLFLKKAFGTGYQLCIEKKETGLDVPGLLSIIRRTVPGAEATGETLNAIRVTLGTNDTKGLHVMFRELERKSDSLGIRHIGVTVSTMEDVYIKVNLEEGAGEQVGDENIEECAIQTITNLRDRQPNPFQRLRALLQKRLTYAINVWSTALIGTIVPFLVFWASLALEYSIVSNLAKEVSGKGSGFFNLISMEGTYPSGGAFLEYDGHNRDLAESYYRPLLTSIGSSVTTLKDAQSALLDIGEEDFEKYTESYVVGASVVGGQMHAWYNPFYSLSPLISVNLASTALLRFYTKDKTAVISLGVRFNASGGPLQRLQHQRPKKRSSQSQTALVQFFGNTIRTMLRTVFFSLGASFIVAAAVVFPVTERTSYCKHLQLMSGVSSTLFWISNYLFDAVIYALTWISVGALYVLYYPILPMTTVAAFLWIFASSFLAISVAYCFSLLVATQAGGFTSVELFFFFGGLVANGIVVWETMMPGTLPGAAVTTASVLPPFLVSGSLIKLLNLDRGIRDCLRYYRSKVGDKSGLDYLCPNQKPILFAGMKRCCKQYHANKAESEILPSPLMLDEDGILKDLLITFGEGIIAFAFVCIVDLGSVIRPGTVQSQVARDDDVEQERRLVEDLCARKDFSAYSLVVQNLQKYYGNFMAVKGVSFTVHPKECFGLLGVNGAGKSTTFQMLTGFLRPSSGEAYTDNVVMSSNIRMWQSNIGYCTQYEGLLGKLNSYQSLYLYARLRGVPEKNITGVVDSMIKVVDLSPHAQKMCESYSGGNKRKLSMAIAMIGLPKLVFLDEPSAGVDVVARRKIFASIRTIRAASGISMVLTSHSMDECEAACDRIAIMVDGQFYCLGPLQHLKEKFGRGCSLTLKMAAKDESQRQQVEAITAATFPGIQLKEYHEGVFEYQLEAAMSWSELFRRIAVINQQFAFEHVLVSDTTLEQIFIGLARKKEHHGAGAPAGSVA